IITAPVAGGLPGEGLWASGRFFAIPAASEGQDDQTQQERKDVPHRERRARLRPPNTARRRNRAGSDSTPASSRRLRLRWSTSTRSSWSPRRPSRGDSRGRRSSWSRGVKICLRLAVIKNPPDLADWTLTRGIRIWSVNGQWEVPVGG